MPAEHSQRVLSVPIRRCIDLLSAEEREKLSATEFLRPFREHGVLVGRSCQAMVERMLGQKGESFDYDALIAAADDFVACCDGRTDDAFHVLDFYTQLTGNRAGSTVREHRVKRAQDARIVQR
jgi:hypothetical protein